MSDRIPSAIQTIELPLPFGRALISNLECRPPTNAETVEGFPDRRRCRVANIELETACEQCLNRYFELDVSSS